MVQQVKMFQNKNTVNRIFHLNRCSMMLLIKLVIYFTKTILKHLNKNEETFIFWKHVSIFLIILWQDNIFSCSGAAVCQHSNGQRIGKRIRRFLSNYEKIEHRGNIKILLHTVSLILIQIFLVFWGSWSIHSKINPLDSILSDFTLHNVGCIWYSKM